MTRKHFIAIAEAIQELGLYPTKEEVALAIARAVGQFNGNFDRERFISKCLSGGK